MKLKRPPLRIQPTTLWDYPSQDYGEGHQGRPGYKGATPSYIIWNLLQRYTKPKDLVVDPCAGSGTTLDVARDLERRALGYDLAPTRKDIFRVDARKMPLQNEKGILFSSILRTARTSNIPTIPAASASSMRPSRRTTRRWIRSSRKFTASCARIGTWGCMSAIRL